MDIKTFKQYEKIGNKIYSYLNITLTRKLSHEEYRRLVKLIHSLFLSYQGNINKYIK